MPPTKTRTIFNPAIWGPVLLAGVKLLFTRQVPWYSKALVLAAFAYAICPFDFDFFPVIGWVDDVAVVLGLFSLALYLVPRGVIKDNPMDKPQPQPESQAAAQPAPPRTLALEPTPPAQPGPAHADARGR